MFLIRVSSSNISVGGTKKDITTETLVTNTKSSCYKHGIELKTLVNRGTKPLSSFMNGRRPYRLLVLIISYLS